LFNNVTKKVFILTAFIFILCTLAYATGPKVESISMSPPNPGWGQAFVLTMTICDQDSGQAYLAVAISTQNTPSTPGSGKQIFLVGVNGVNVKTTYQNLWQGGQMGYDAVSNVAYNEDTCTDCGVGGSPVNGGLRTLTYNLTMPDASDLGASACDGDASTLYLLVGTSEYNLDGSASGWPSLTGCEMNVVSWTVPAPPADSLTLNKRVEGVLQNVGDLVLFSVDYTYGNGPLTITDAIPGGGSLALVSVGPSSITGGSVTPPAVGSTSGTVTWTFPTSTYTKSGTVWMLLQMTTAMSSGTQVANTANGTAGSNNASSSATLTVGQAAISVQKIESQTSFIKATNATVTITYFLNYQVNGDQLKAYRAFDDTATGAYSSSPPAGWKFLPTSAGYNGTWTISDPCGTGDRIMTGSVTGSAEYPGILLDDPNPANVQMCTGIVEADAMINPGDYPGADALIILRSNGYNNANLRTYNLLLSIDTAPANSYIGYQKCTGIVSGSCVWYPATPEAATLALTITANTWYRTKTWMTQNGNDYVFQSKVWLVGQPEPTSYQLTWTDTGAATTDFNCGAGATYTDWRPGVNEQGNDQDGTTQDSYNNFTVLVPRVAANATLFDTVPTGLTYAGSNPTAGTDGSMITWQLGNISDQSGSYTWWATTSACAQSFTNVGGIGATGIISEFSNPVVFSVLCVSPTFTITSTSTPTPTVNPNTPTFTITKTDTATNTSTPTDTRTPTSTDTYTNTPTYTNTYTFTPTNTRTNTPSVTFTYTNTVTYTNTYTYTSTFTPTLTPTVTFTSSVTFTRTYTPTYTQTPSPTLTPTNTNTASVTFTYTNTVTYTYTYTVTPSTTNTVTRTFTPTYTPSLTATPTPTYTNTLSPTSSFTQTVTYTFTFTPTPSMTRTDTMTITYTNTPSPTPTASPTYTNTLSPTSSFTQTVTYTSTFTPTPSNTITSTYTITMTYTEVIISATITQTYTVTRTSTVTYTASPTNTNSPTQTVTLSPTSTYSNTVTYTSTYTPTPSETVTDTMTITPTSTISPVDTLTITATNSPTVTSSPTSTVTYTFTYTPTLTNTIPNPPSYTNTPTWTPTYTSTPTDTATPTATQTYTNSPVDTLTNTLTYTPTFTETSTYTATPTATATYTDSPVDTLTDTMTQTPTDTNTSTYTLTYTYTAVNTWTDTPTESPSYTNTNTSTSTGTITYTSTASLTPTVTITPVPFPYTMSIGIYNEAGELVKSITVTTASSEPLGVGLYDASGNSTNVIVPGSLPNELSIAVPGIQTPESQNKNQTVSFLWDGTNDAGQDVENGVYYIKETTTDTFGHTEVITKPVTAINSSQYAEINIYNSAGEIVDTIIGPYDGSSALSLNLINSSGNSNNSTYPVGQGVLTMMINYTASNSLPWYGTDSQNNYVSSGVYEVQLVVKTNQGLKVVSSKTVTLLALGPQGGLMDGLKAYPNPYAGTSPAQITIAWTSGTSGAVRIKIYNIAGELVRILTGDLNTGYINWDLRATGGQKASNGTYICVVEGTDSNQDQKTKIIKVSVIQGAQQ